MYRTRIYAWYKAKEDTYEVILFVLSVIATEC